jgi:uncharacterized protein (DUF952 family)
MVLHITHREAWEASLSGGYYRPASLDSEGFIHCSTIDQAIDTANGFFRGEKGLVLLCIDEKKIDAELRYEPPAGGAVKDSRVYDLFPHLYGPLNVSAVVGVAKLAPDAEGKFIMPVEIGKLIQD